MRRSLRISSINDDGGRQIDSQIIVQTRKHRSTKIYVSASFFCTVWWLRHVSTITIFVLILVYTLNHRLRDDQQPLLKGSHWIDTYSNSAVNYGNHSIALIVAYRDLYPEQNRSDHLNKFVPHMIQFLDKSVSENKIRDYHIYIIEQSNDGLKFNRGKLMNIGYDYAKHITNAGHEHDIFIFHDVDLLPQDNLIDWYTKYPDNPIHLSHVWPKYADFTGCVGGVISFSSVDYEQINGFPNNYWGWGGEDDAMAVRLMRAGIKISDTTSGSYTDLEGTTRQEKVRWIQKNSNWRNPSMWSLNFDNFRTWRINGLNSLKYEILETMPSHESDKATKVTVNVGLNGNHWSNTVAPVDYKEFSWANWISDSVLLYY